MRWIQTRYQTNVKQYKPLQCVQEQKTSITITSGNKENGQASRSDAMHELIHKVEEVAHVVCTAKFSIWRKRIFSSREEREGIKASDFKNLESTASDAFLHLSHSFPNVESHKLLAISFFEVDLINFNIFL